MAPKKKTGIHGLKGGKVSKITKAKTNTLAKKKTGLFTMKEILQKNEAENTRAEKQAAKMSKAKDQDFTPPEEDDDRSSIEFYENESLAFVESEDDEEQTLGKPFDLIEGPTVMEDDATTKRQAKAARADRDGFTKLDKKRKRNARAMLNRLAMDGQKDADLDDEQLDDVLDWSQDDPGANSILVAHPEGDFVGQGDGLYIRKKGAGKGQEVVKRTTRTREFEGVDRDLYNREVAPDYGFGVAPFKPRTRKHQKDEQKDE